MKSRNKLFNKIRSIILSVTVGRYSEREGYDKIEEVMDIYNKLRKNNLYT